MAEDAPTEDLSEDTRHAQDTQPERLRVDSLARVLGTTSERVLEALTELDGRPRTAESTVEEDEAQRVRQALADSPEEAATPEPTDTSEPTDGDEPESRLILETPAGETPERTEYMPLFVAPRAVQFDYDADADADADDDDDDDDCQDTDDDQSERPSGRRRRRGRRGRGRGRGEQNGDDSDADGDDSQDSDQDGDDSDDSDEDTGDDENTGADGATRRRRRRRRRKTGSGDDSEGGASPDDPPNTVVHEREPRKSARGDKSSRAAMARSRASAGRPGWRPNGSAGATAGMPAGAVRRS